MLAGEDFELDDLNGRLGGAGHGPGLGGLGGARYDGPGGVGLGGGWSEEMDMLRRGGRGLI